MKTYNVQVFRIVNQLETFKVSANSKKEALKIADEVAKNYDFKNIEHFKMDIL